jgi:polyphosphate kinase
MKPRIETHKYRTPLADNREADYSVGVMQLTETEAELVISFAQNLQAERAAQAVRDKIARQRQETSSEMRDRMLGRLTVTGTEIYEQQYARLQGKDFVPDEANKPEPTEPGNRFSGLDLPE